MWNNESCRIATSLLNCLLLAFVAETIARPATFDLESRNAPMTSDESDDVSSEEAEAEVLAVFETTDRETGECRSK